MLGLHLLHVVNELSHANAVVLRYHILPCRLDRDAPQNHIHGPMFLVFVSRYAKLTSKAVFLQVYVFLWFGVLRSTRERSVSVECWAAAVVVGR